jgi:hypothetical protein
VARLKSWPSRAWRFPNPQRDGVVESHPSQSARRMGQPSFVVASAKQQVPHRAFSPVRNDKLYYHYRLVARLKSWPSRAWRFPNPQRDGAVESHSSQSARRTGHPLSWWCRQTAGSSPGFRPGSE